MRKEKLVDALDKLLPLRGLWHGLQLGNMHKYIALHYDEQIEHGLDHVTKIWELITDDDPELKEHVDVDTVQGLELLAPWRKADAILIRTRMERKLIFPLVSDPSKRNYLLQRILELRTIIPSIMTFHENMKYFSIGAKILTKFLIGDKAVLVPQDGKERTVQAYLQHYWRQSQSILIQVDQERYQPVLEPSFLLVLREIFLFALRNFPFLSTEHPKQDQRGESMPAVVDEGYIAHLHERARQLGLLTPAVIKSPMRDLSKVQLPSFSVSKSHPSRWNCGKPPLRSYLEVHHHAFLMAFENMTFEERLTPILVQSDFMKAFFGHEAVITDGEAAVLDHVTYKLGGPTNRKDVNTGRNRKTKRGAIGEAASRLKQQTTQADSSINKRTKAWSMPKGVVPTLARLRPKRLPIPLEPPGVQQQATRTSPMLGLQTSTNHTLKETLKKRTRSASPQNEAAIRHAPSIRFIKRQRILPPLPPSPKDKAAKAQRSPTRTPSQSPPPTTAKVYRQRFRVRERTGTPPPTQEAATTVALDEPIRTRRQAQRRSAIQNLNESPPVGVTQPRRGRSPVGHQQKTSASPISSSQKDIALGEATELRRQPQRRSAIESPDESPPPGVTQTFRKRSALWSPTTQSNQVIETFAETRCYPGSAGPDTLLHRGQNGEESEEEL